MDIGDVHLAEAILIWRERDVFKLGVVLSVFFIELLVIRHFYRPNFGGLAFSKLFAGGHQIGHVGNLLLVLLIDFNNLIGVLGTLFFTAAEHVDIIIRQNI